MHLHAYLCNHFCFGDFEINAKKNFGKNMRSCFMPLLSVYAQEIGLSFCKDFSGAWNTNWGKMFLKQIGNGLNGTYEHDKGKIQGKVSDRFFEGTWSEAPSYKPPSDAGTVKLTLSEDGKSFSGKWGYGSTLDNGSWSGTRDCKPIPVEK